MCVCVSVCLSDVASLQYGQLSLYETLMHGNVIGVTPAGGSTVQLARNDVYSACRRH